MEGAELKEWQKLHHRAALGEPLGPEEQARYQAGLRSMERSEAFPGQMAALREARRRLAAMEAERAALLAKHAKLDEEIARLEAVLAAREGTLLGAGD